VSSIPPAPSCAATPVPSTGATNIGIFQQLSWAASSGATSYDVYFGTATNPSLSGNVATTTFNPGALLSSTTYYWKVVPKNASGSATGCTEWTFTTGNNVNMATGSITKCSGNFYDSGGSAAAYLDNEDYTLTICPVSPTDKVNVNFSAFSTEAGYDGLMIYNGNSTAAPLISSGAAAGSNATSCPAGAYSGSTSPGSVTSTASDGCLTFRFRSESSGTSTGWTATVSCVAPPACAAPVSAAATSIAATTAQANWDLTTGDFIVEYGPTSTFGTPGTGASAGNVNNTVVTATNTNLKVLSGLTPVTGYSYVIRQDCTGSSNGYSANSTAKTFTTLVACPAPTASAATLVTGNTAQANWNLSSGNFIVEYGPTSTFGTPGTGATAGNVNNTVVTASNTNLKALSGLTGSTGYSYVVRQDCTGSSNGYSANSSVITFTTLLDCSAATVLSCGASVTTGNLATTGGLYNPPSTTCGFSTPGKEKLYSFVPAITGTHQINITSVNSGTGYIDYFYKNATSGDCSSTGWTCILDANAVTTLTIGTLTAGVTYFILLDAESSASTANHTFQIICPVACPAPVSNAATLITHNSAQANWTLSTGSFIVEYGPTSTFGAPGTDAFAGNVNNTVVTVTNDNKLSLSSLLSATGYSYVVRQDCSGSSNGYSLNSGTITFTTAIAPPANDICSGAISLTPGATCVGTAGSTAGATDNNETGDCVTGTENSVWYSFVAAATSQVVTVVGAVGFDPVVSAISTCGSATQPTGGTCTNATADAGTETLNLTGLTIGNTYYIQVHDNQGDALSSSTFTICVSLPPSMTYTSSAITQQTGAAAAGSQYQKILQLNIVTTNSYNPLSVSQLDFSTSGTPGTTNVSDLTNARVYYTGSTSTWTDGSVSGTQFGSTLANPNGAMPFSGSQVLSAGSNYFWLVYDLTCGAVGTNIDASMPTNGITLSSGGPYTPTTPDPATTRTVTALASYNTLANGNWSNPAIWSCGVPPNGTASAININHNVVLDADVSIQSTVTVAASKTLDISTNSLTIGGAGSGTQNLVINGVVNVSASTLNVGTSTGVTTSNITVATGASMTVSGSGIVNLGPTGGYNRTLSVTGTFTNSGTVNVNGNVVFNTNSTFNMSGGTLTIDGNGSASVATGTNLLQFGLSGSTSILLNGTGGTITIVDPHASNSATNLAVGVSIGSGNVPATSLAGITFQFGDGLSATAGNTSGFVFDTYQSTKNVPLGNVLVNGGNAATRFVSGTSLTGNASDIAGTLTINSGSELRTASSRGIGVYGNIVNDGIFSVTSASSGVLFLGGTQLGSAPAATTVQTISGNGVWRNSTTASTASLNSLTMNNAAGTTLMVPLTVGNTLTLTSGKLFTDAVNYLGVGTGLSPSGTIGTGTVTVSSTLTASHIVGPIRRAIPSATTWLINDQRGLFPIGDGTTGRQLNIAVTTNATPGSLSGSFNSADPGNPPAPYSDGGTNNIAFTSPSGYWNVEYTNGAAGGGYTVQVNATGFTKRGGAAITDFANIRLIKRPSAGTWAAGADGTPQTPSGLSAVSRTLCSTFSDFAIGGTGAALPLELASFTGKTLATTNLLLWETLTEKNVQSHILERSIDGIHWTEVGRKSGQLDSHSPLKYELEDRTPPAKAFYRLRSVDVDGQENLSNSIVLTRKSDHFGITAAFPSPTSDQVTVQFGSLTEERVTVRVTDFTGRLVLEQQFDAQHGINEVPVQLGNLQAGVYLVSIANANASAPPVRIVKE